MEEFKQLENEKYVYCYDDWKIEFECVCLDWDKKWSRKRYYKNWQIHLQFNSFWWPLTYFSTRLRDIWIFLWKDFWRVISDGDLILDYNFYEYPKDWSEYIWHYDTYVWYYPWIIHYVWRYDWKFVEYSEKWDIVIECDYSDWLRNWKFVEYYADNSQIKEEWFFKNNKREGKYTKYFKTWQIEEVCCYIEWERDWKYVDYYMDWRICREANYSKWELIWKFKRYD